MRFTFSAETIETGAVNEVRFRPEIETKTNILSFRSLFSIRVPCISRCYWTFERHFSTKTTRFSPKTKMAENIRNRRFRHRKRNQFSIGLYFTGTWWLSKNAGYFRSSYSNAFISRLTRFIMKTSFQIYGCVSVGKKFQIDHHLAK